MEGINPNGPKTEENVQDKKHRKSPKKRHGKMRNEISAISVYDMMTKDVIVIDSQNSLATLVSVLKDRDISGVPVVEHDNLVGAVSRKDVFNASGVDDIDKITDDIMEKLKTIRVRDVMKKPITIFYKSSIGKAAETMKRHSINRLIVVDEDGKMVGIVSKTDLIRSTSKIIVKKRMETTMDEVLDVIEKRGSIPIDELAARFHVDRAVVEEWAKILEEHKLVTINYPVIGKPYISVAKEQE